MRIAELDMHPLDVAGPRRHGPGRVRPGLCNITKCCTEVCPEHIKITDNALIPMEGARVADRKYDPIVWLGNKLFSASRQRHDSASRSSIWALNSIRQWVPSTERPINDERHEDAETPQRQRHSHRHP